MSGGGFALPNLWKCGLMPLTPTLSHREREKYTSTHRAPDKVALMERRGARRNARHGLGGAGGIHQHKAGVVLRFRPHALAFVIQRQHVAGGNTERAGERLLVRADVELSV